MISKERLLKYASLHTKLKAYNKLQWDARNVPIMMGNMEFDAAIVSLELLKRALKNKNDYNDKASEFDIIGNNKLKELDWRSFK